MTAVQQTGAAPDAFDSSVARLFDRIVPGGRLDTVTRLSGGASQESWLIIGRRRDDTLAEFVMRRGRGGVGHIRDVEVGLAGEARVIKAAAQHGVPVPDVVHELEPADGLGDGFVMVRLHGETIARKILRDTRFDAVRPKLAGMCGAAIANIAKIPTEGMNLAVMPAKERIAALRRRYTALGHRRPVFEYGFRWLEERAESDPAAPRMVHGDFRNGNLMIDEQGIAGVLDWERVHAGDPIEDMGWVCTPSWRFGEIDKAAGGFGTAEQLIEGYEAAGGGTVDRSLLQFWTTAGAVNWGVACILFAFEFRNGDRTVERASIGRRISECEMDIMMLTGAKEGELL